MDKDCGRGFRCDVSAYRCVQAECVSDADCVRGVCVRGECQGLKCDPPGREMNGYVDEGNLMCYCFDLLIIPVFIVSGMFMCNPGYVWAKDISLIGDDALFAFNGTSVHRFLDAGLVEYKSHGNK